MRALSYDLYAVGSGQFRTAGIPKAFLGSFSTRIFELKTSQVQTINEITKFTHQPKKHIKQKYLHVLWEDRKNYFDGAKCY